MPPKVVHNDQFIVLSEIENAFLFQGKYVVDIEYIEDIRHCGNLATLQLDKFSITGEMRTRFPRILELFRARNEDEKKSTILIPDFAYYVLQNEEFKTGFTVVPINQQNDIRAINLKLMPGYDRTTYRSTDIVPRDGLSLGGDYLPRFVTIVKCEKTGYQFKVTFAGETTRKLIGFNRTNAEEIYRKEVVPLLASRLPDYEKDNILYQKLCASFLRVFPDRATTPVVFIEPPPPPPSARAIRLDEERSIKNAKKEKAARAEALRALDQKKCKTCGEIKEIGDFEADERSDCKDCRKARRVEAIRNAPEIDRETVERPLSCIECCRGGDECKFTFRTDQITAAYRNTCNDCHNSKGYSEKSREKRREEDLEGYLAMGAASQQKWRDAHPDKNEENRHRRLVLPEPRMLDIVASARKRNIFVNIDDISKMEGKLALCCVYCTFLPAKDEPLNGLDRIDSSGGYTDLNTVPCCATCNAMKGSLDVDVFIAKVREIKIYSQSFGSGVPRVRLPAFSGRAELRNASKKEKIDYLADEKKIEIWSSPCYLCGSAPSFGIDREDADGDYTVENSRPCCTDCNYMKKDLGLADFKRHISYIDGHTKREIDDISDKPLKIMGNARVPVTMRNSDGVKIAVFPSASTLAAITTTAKRFNKSLGNKTYSTTVASNREFRRQHLDDVGAGRRVYKFLIGI